ncbi:hypothetical protein AgCh_014813 [Apium graveolens]
MLKLLAEMLPAKNELPTSTYEAKKILCPMGMNLKKIHACPNDCVLFHKEHEHLHTCPKCGASRYKRDGNNSSTNDKRPPVKVLRCLPIVERFRRLFANSNDAKLVRWHVEGRKLDGMLMLTLLIPGPKEAGNNIDVYLQPLIEDLKLLWDQGEKMYDAYSQTYFNLRAMIFCTISDFPGYGNLSGYMIKGAKACSIYEDATIDLRLKNCKKNVYMGHHTFLPLTHPYRKRKNDFDGTIETRVARLPLTGKEDLPYWEHFQVRHCLDFMHIEKNVYESIIGTLLNIPGKMKDGMKARLDLQELGVRAELAPQQSGKRMYLPLACYTLSRKEKISFCECLSSVKVPSGYSSNPKNLVSMKDLKLLASTNPVGIPRSRHEGRLDGQGTVGHKMITPGAEMLDIAHLFVLQHMTEVNPYLQEHILEIRRKNPSKGGKWVTNEHNRSFVKWFKDRVMSQYSKSP